MSDGSARNARHDRVSVSRSSKGWWSAWVPENAYATTRFTGSVVAHSRDEATIDSAAHAAPSPRHRITANGSAITPYVGTSAKAAHTFNVTTTTETITGLANGTTCTFKVAAKHSIGTGPQSTSSRAGKRTEAPRPEIANEVHNHGG
jgi:hypothetical protein